MLLLLALIILVLQNSLLQLLDRSPPLRLGYEKGFFPRIREDPFFRTVSWEDLEKEMVAPPYVPSSGGAVSRLVVKYKHTDLFVHYNLRVSEKKGRKVESYLITGFPSLIMFFICLKRLTINSIFCKGLIDRSHGKHCLKETSTLNTNQR